MFYKNDSLASIVIDTIFIGIWLFFYGPASALFLVFCMVLVDFIFSLIRDKR